MFLIFSAILLANASTTVHSSTQISGEGNTYTHIQTTVNGNTTTVDSTNPGKITVEKTDSGESISSDNPVNVTHASATPTPTKTTEDIHDSVQIPAKNFQQINNHPDLITFLRTLWDRVKNTIVFDILTRK
jgi:hypothetical protein